MITRPHRWLAALVSCLAAAGLSAFATAAPASATPGIAGASVTSRLVPACGVAPAGQARCFALVRQQATHGAAESADADQIAGLTPTDITSAYQLQGGTSGTVGIVDGYDDPNAEADLAVYRAHFGLPACTSQNGCFRKVNQGGAAQPLPFPDPGWAVEISLDLDAVSAACPACKILLVEGNQPSLKALGVAVDTAVRLGATAVSNSYGADEGGYLNKFAKYYVHPGVPIVASSGDHGFTTAQFPAVLTTTIGVGGTLLTPTGGSYTEKVWRGAGSGCSAYIAKPAWQHDTHCLMRTVADVSAAADGPEGYAIYDSYEYEQFTDSPWFGVAGTSLSSPLITAMIVRAGHASSYSDASSLYRHAAEFHDIVAGSNGYCGHDYLCTGKPGYDAPTGVGTPAGLGGL